MAVMEKTPLHKSQYAYRGGRSTENALYDLTEIIQKILDEKEISICALLDISGAFGNTLHEAIKSSLERRRVNKRLTR